MKKLYNFIENKLLFIVPILIIILLYLHVYYFPNLHIGFIALALALVALYRKGNKIKDLTGRQDELTQIINNLFDNCPDYIFIKDMNFNYVSANKSLLEFLNIDSISEGDFRTEYDFFSSEEAEIRIERDRKIIKNAETFVYDSVYKTANKEVILEVTKAPLLNENKEVFGIIGIMRDVTLERFYQNKLEKEQIVLLSIVDNLPFVAYLRDLQGNLIYKNKLCADLFKGNDQEHGEELFLNFYKENMQEILEMDYEVLSTKQPYIQHKNFLINNKNYLFEVHKIPILKNDIVDKLLVVAKDITLDKEIDLQKETFVATLSHDLKTPTTAQIKALEYILENENTALNRQDKEILSDVYNSCKYMYKMIHNLISTYKYSDGKIELNYESFDLIELLYECCKEIRYLYEERKQMLKFDFELGQCIVVADRLEIKRVIMNLLANAISYSGQNSMIKVSVEENNDKVSFSIANNDSNIKERDLNTFFDKFAACSDKYKKTSSGLGLYLSKQIIEAHEGSIFVKKQDDEYIFVFELFKEKMVSKKSQTQDGLV